MAPRSHPRPQIGKLYWLDSSRVRRVNLDGSEPTEFMRGLDSPGLLKIDHHSRTIYWLNTPGGNANSTERASLDGSERTTIFDFSVSSLAIDAEGTGTPLPEEEEQEEQSLLMPLIVAD